RGVALRPQTLVFATTSIGGTPATAARFHMPLPLPLAGERGAGGGWRTEFPPSAIDIIYIFCTSAILPTNAPTTAARLDSPARPPNAGICGHFCKRGPAISPRPP